MMYAKQPKKLAIVNILDILKKYTDENHRLSQKEIQDILAREYEMKLDRKAVKRNLMNLIEFGYDINYSESVRVCRDQDGGEQENVILSDFYLEREFTDSELRLLIDSVLFSNHIPYQQDRELVEKLSSLSNIYFKSRVKHIARMPEDKTDNKQLFYNVELLDEAISEGRKVRFHYLEYRSDKKLHKRCDSEGRVREYIISPYQLVAKEGKYYLICNYDKFDNVSNYRVDRMTDMEILSEHVKPFHTLTGSDGRPLDLKEYMEKHIYMFAGDNIRAVFRADKSMISDIIDLFGKDVKFSDESEDEITVTAEVNEPSMEHFAKAYSPYIEIIKPVALREKMIYNLNKAIKKYQKSRMEIRSKGFGDMKKELKWAVLGTGVIANEMAAGLQKMGRPLYAVGNRTYEKAVAFAEKYDIRKVYHSIDEMFTDEDVDIIYITSPHNTHCGFMKKALDSGKHLLVEKSITLNSDELDGMIALADSKGLILAEAMTIWHMPLYKELWRIVESGELGRVQMITVNFGSFKEYDMSSRFFNRSLAGGAMLDIGVYALSIVRSFMSEAPKQIVSQWKPAPTGVDEQATVLLQNDVGQMAAVALTMHSKQPKRAMISCEKGYIEIMEFPRADRAVIVDAQTGERREITAGASADALCYELTDMERAVLRADGGEMKLAYTKDVMDIMTKLRADWGLRYPEEES